VARKRAVLIAGPTASGKSELATKVAQGLGGWVINADSMQVYSELSILTARPTAKREAALPHRLYGVVSGQERFSVGAWLGLAEAQISAAWSAGAIPVVVGGTGLYFEALTKGLTEIPEVPQRLREKWRQFGADHPIETLHAELGARDPEMARRLQVGDSQRLIRALEVIDATGRSLADWQRDANRPTVLKGADTTHIVLAPDRQILYARTDARAVDMVDKGALGEVEALLARNYADTSPVMKAIGMAELGAHLGGGLPLDDAITQMQTRTRHYAKRQFTWIRGRMADWVQVRSVSDGLALFDAEIRT